MERKQCIVDCRTIGNFDEIDFDGLLDITLLLITHASMTIVSADYSKSEHKYIQTCMFISRPYCPHTIIWLMLRHSAMIAEFSDRHVSI